MKVQNDYQTQDDHQTRLKRLLAYAERENNLEYRRQVSHKLSDMMEEIYPRIKNVIETYNTCVKISKEIPACDFNLESFTVARTVSNNTLVYINGGCLEMKYLNNNGIAPFNVCRATENGLIDTGTGELLALDKNLSVSTARETTYQFIQNFIAFEEFFNRSIDNKLEAKEQENPLCPFKTKEESKSSVEISLE